MKKLYKIGEFSKLCRVTVKTLRHYEDLGIFNPAIVDESSVVFH
ncbi:MAG: MerR family DNA-binding transcriptional regulator [Muribaculaceae bacterium]